MILNLSVSSFTDTSDDDSGFHMTFIDSGYYLGSIIT